MFFTIVSTLVLLFLFSIWPTTASPSTSGAIVTPSSFQTTVTLSINHTLPITTAVSATAPDATITALETIVVDPTHIHEVVAVTEGPEGPLTFIVDCPLSNGGGATLVCTIVEEKTATTLSGVTTVTQDASQTRPFALPTLPASPSAASKNGAAGALGAAGASVLAGAVVGAMLAGAMV